MLLRIKYGKTEAGRFLAHLDLMRAWQKVFKRAGVPLAYSQGFNPHPLISFGSALAVGVTGSGEYLDVELKEEIEAEINLLEIEKAIRETLPQALSFAKIVRMEDKTPSLMSIINRAKYTAEAQRGEIPAEAFPEALEEILASSEIKIIRFSKGKHKEKDIRTGIFSINIEETANGYLKIGMLVETGSQGNVRPEEVLEVLGRAGILKPDGAKIHREGLYVADNSGLKEPTKH